MARFSVPRPPAGAYDDEMSPDGPLTVAMVSLGCCKNLVDSEKILACLAEAGMVVGAPLDDADVIVINTCGFLAAARAESLEVIAEAVAQKRRGRTRRVVVAGCLVNRDAENLYDLAPGADAIVGVNDRQQIAKAVAGDGRWTGLAPPAAGPAVSDAGRFRLTPRHTAYLRIAEGCSHRCTFCTIPSIRGPFRSKPVAAVLDEARELIADGAVELNVIAQDTTCYGSDLPPGANLAHLLRDLDALDGVHWIRLMYTHPRRFTDDLTAALADCSHVVPYVDIPLQHMADRVLKRMGRGVTARAQRDLLTRLRERVEGLAIRTTFIVGFPDETDEEFAELLAFVKDFRLEAMGAFAFSAEAGTAAAAMDAQVSGEVKAGRVEALMGAQQEIVFEANARAVGSDLEILVDGPDGEGYCIGRSPAQAPDIDGVCLLTDPRPAGALVAARVVDWRQYDLIAEPQ